MKKDVNPSSIHPSSIESSPIILSQTQTLNDPLAVVTRHRKVAQQSFEVFIQSEEKTKTHKTETIGWVAIENSNPDENIGYDTHITKRDITNNDEGTRWFSHGFKNPFIAPPIVFTSMQTANGGNTSAMRVKGISSKALQFKIEEEQSKDKELYHTKEIIGIFAVEM